MNVLYRKMVPGDIHTIRRFMPFAFSETTAGMVAADKDTGRTLGIVIAQEWTPTSCMVHQLIITPMILRPKYKFLWNVGEWLFGKAGLKKIYGLVPENNWKALNINEKMGFTEVARLEDAYDHGVDYILMELKAENAVHWQAPEMEKVANG